VVAGSHHPRRRRGALDLTDLAAVHAALDAFEAPRKPHTAMQSQMAYRLGRLFHHLPGPLRPIRDLVLDHTPMLQKQVGEKSPQEIVAQLAEIDAVETAFRRTIGG
jgi:2-polyprenyl-6-methoxyphenol hydroxylase-like FAD-dependent oxidoreductase